MQVCKVCRNTGMRPLSNNLDCTDCNSAVERAAFNKWRERQLNSIGTENDDWAIYQRALAMAPKQEAPEVHDPIGTLARNRNGSDESLIFTPLFDIHVTDGMPLYAAPAAANGALTDEKIIEVFNKDQYWGDPGMIAFARAILAAAGPDAALVALIHKAQSILAHHLPPDGPDAKTTISALLGLLDGPESRAALSGAKGN